MSDAVNNTQPDPQPAPTQRKQPWMRVAAWITGSMIAVLLIVVIAGAVLLNNQRFHNYVLATVEQKASESLGVRVQVHNYGLNLSRLGLDIYGLTVDGAAPYASPALLQVDHAEASVRVVSILHTKWYLDSFRVDRPIVHIIVDARGVSNLPTIKSSGDNSSNTSIFDLGIRQAVLDRGEVYYNDKKSPLAADLHDVEFKASFDPSQKKYSGKLSYTDGHLTSGTLKTIPHNLEADFDATPTTFHLTRSRFSTGPSQVLLTATVQNYSDPVADAHYDATVDGSQIGQILESPSVPSGQVHATGNLHYQQLAKRSAIESLLVDGDLDSSRLDVKTPSLRTRVTNLVAHYSLTNGDATIKGLRLNVLGGTVTGSGTMTQITGDSHAKVNASVRNVSLAELKSLAGTSAASRSVSLAGGVNAELGATWGKTFKDLVAHADATIKGEVRGTGHNAAGFTVVKANGNAVSASRIPIEGSIHGVYTGTTEQVSLTNSFLRTPKTSLTLNGVVSDRSSLDLKFQANDLAEIGRLRTCLERRLRASNCSHLALKGSHLFRERFVEV